MEPTAVNMMGIKDLVGKSIKPGYDTPLTIVGVFKDFIIGSPYQAISPMVVFGNKNFNTLLRLNKHNSTAKNLKISEQIFKKYNSAYPFSYRFADLQFAQKFKEEKQTGILSALFAGLTIFISCLGLLGRAAYMAENCSLEIGIRKVLGAKVSGIAKMLSKEFVMLVVIAIAIAVLVSWWAINKWLQDFTYRIDIGWTTFAIAGLTAILMTALTVSFQAVKAALVNPVKSLKSE